MTVSVLVAAGVAVYQSPQFQQWINSSRRRIALALHNLGDEIQPSANVRGDISMSEEVSEAAEERRRIARADITKRAAMLESRRKARESQGPLESFDTLVDKDGHLRLAKDEQADADAVGCSTGVGLDAPQPVRRGDVTALDRHRLSLGISSETLSNHPSESVVQLTPTSSAPSDVLFDPFSDTPVRGQSPVSGSSHTEDNEQIYYAHPPSRSNTSHQHDLLTDLDDFTPGNQYQHPVSSAPSTAGSFSHIGGFDASTDGTLSDPDAHSVGGIATPASWSEVGSVVSNDDAGHHQLL